MNAPTAPVTRSRLVPMRPRDPNEPGRTASTLELFFDLVFVVAVGIASVQLAHQLADGHVLHGLRSYAVVFFGIWWAWMNFTWFATSFATDDWLYRLLTILQMLGVLVLAAGIEPAFDHDDYALLVYGYVIIRIAMVPQWLRASRCADDPRTTRAYAAGIAGAQVLWLLFLTLPPEAARLALPVLIAVELAVPLVAERRGTTPWHPHHITERYGLFTLIVLGESLMASANASIEALHADAPVVPLIGVSITSLVVTAALWWIYFWPPHHEAIGGLRQSLRYGYTHYFVFAAAGAVSAGIEVEIARITGHGELGARGAAFCVTVPVAVFLLAIWWVAIHHHADRTVDAAVLGGAGLILFGPLVPGPLVLAAVVLVLVVAVLVAHPPITAADGAG